MLVGSTDLRIDNPDEALCDEAETDYMLESIRTVFPGIRVDREHIIARFCGVRPLPSAGDGFTGRISRDHSCRDLPPSPERPWPVHSLVGGKWTTFRAFAEQVTDRILSELNRKRLAGSQDLTIGGKTPDPETWDDAALESILRTEAVVHLDDLLLRRTPLALYGMLDRKRFDEIAALAARTLGWDDARLASETNHTLDLLSQRHGVHFR